MANPISLNNKKFKQGIFQPKNRQKVIGDLTRLNYKSSWELKFMQMLDDNPDIIKWASEPLFIPYFSTADQKQRKYYIDFIFECKTKDGSLKTYLVEIKPMAQCKPPRQSRNKHLLKETHEFITNQCKWEAARLFAKKHGWEFVVLTEYDLFPGKFKKKNK